MTTVQRAPRARQLRRSRIAAVALPMLVVSITAMGGCSKDSTTATTSPSTAAPTTTAAPSTTAKAAGTTTVVSTPGAIDIKDYSFTPSAATAKIGEKVTWTNHDDNAHYVKSDSPDTTLDSGTMDPGGQPYSVTFTKAGTYAYHCNIHNTMKGSVVVS